MRHPLTLLAVLFLILAVCAGCSPAPRSSAVEPSGPGGIAIGQTRAALEAAHPSWKVVKERSTALGSQLVTYRDWHWSWTYGVAHGAEFHRVTYQGGEVIAWSSNSEAE